MPTKKKPVKKAIKRAAKSTARTRKSGVKLVKASERAAKKAGKNFSASGGRKYAKAVTSAQTAANLEQEGRKRIKTGKKTAKAKNLIVTPRSAAKKMKAQEKRYNTRKRK